ncbi:MAG: hypothetical protein LBK25_09050 [Treponema sp.]|jgi:hypothetical protein|nr:hypothetical protein [Treponema sp.]
MANIPKSYPAFSDWEKNLLTHVQAHLTEFAIQQAVLTPLLALQTEFETAYARSLDPNRGPVDIAERNRARAAFEKALRAFIKAFLQYSPYVSDKDRDEMRIPIHDTTPTPVPVPTTFPEYSIDTSTPARLVVRFWDEASKQRGKPKGVHGAEIRWEEREDTPAKAEDLANSDFATRTPRTFAFTGDNQGRKVYFCLRWENNTGEKGPWGAIVHAIVP